MSNSPVFVVDVGSTKVVCLAASLTAAGEVRVEAVASVACSALKKGLVEDVDALSAAIDEAATRIERTMGAPVEDVAVTINGPHLASVNAQGFIPIYPDTRSIRRDDVLAVISHSRQISTSTDREQVMAVPREFRVDGSRGVTRPIGLTGGRLEVVTHIVTGQSSQIEALDKAVTLAGRRVSEMVVGALASGLGVATDEELEEGCVVVDVGGGTTDVAVFVKGAVAYTGSVPVGGGHVTSDLAQLLKVSLEDAELLKLQSGCAMSRLVPENDAVQVRQVDQSAPRPLQRRVLCEIVESRMREIAALVRRQIVSSGLDGQVGMGLVVTGGGSLLPGVDALFSEVFAPLPARTASPKVAGPQARTVEAPTMSAAVGLARYGLEGDEQEFAPVSGFSSWKDKIRTLKNPFNKKG